MLFCSFLLLVSLMFSENVSSETNGMCETITFVTVNRPKTITYWNSWYMSQRTKTVNDIVTERRTTSTCCAGYELERSSQKCKPICEDSCLNGYCHEPNLCRCNAGYVSMADNGTCQPICSRVCLNGFCVGPEQCECDNGFAMNMTTNICDPVCIPQCVYGDCIAPNKCSCWEGYEKSEVDSCNPICFDECINGYCMSPETCACNDGYINGTSNNTCDPYCSDVLEVGEDCIAPEVIGCVEGYERNVNACQPICSNGCNNGTCIAPDNCECYLGYQKQAINGSDCFRPDNIILLKSNQASSSLWPFVLSIILFLVTALTGVLIIFGWKNYQREDNLVVGRYWNSGEA